VRRVGPDEAKEAGEIARLLSYAVILLASFGLFFAATDIPISRFEKLGSGAFPQIVFAAIAFVAAIAIIDALRKIPGPAYGRFVAVTGAWVRRRYLVFIILGTLALYILAIPITGFSFASFVFVFAVQVILMPRRTKSVVIAFIIALIFSFGLNGLFAEVFTVFLPRGVF
jgi:hypothetical protein